MHHPHGTDHEGCGEHAILRQRQLEVPLRRTSRNNFTMGTLSTLGHQLSSPSRQVCRKGVALLAAKMRRPSLPRRVASVQDLSLFVTLGPFAALGPQGALLSTGAADFSSKERNSHYEAYQPFVLCSQELTGRTLIDELHLNPGTLMRALEVDRAADCQPLG